MRVVVIGGTKFVGPWVVKQLIALGHDVTVYHRGESEAPLPAQAVHVHSPDAGAPVLRFPPELRARKPDVVVHMMALGEADARAVMQFFRGAAQRIVVPGSGDVYRAYGRFTGLEPGPLEPMPLAEDAPLRSVLYPYRKQAKSLEEMQYYYEKILVERVVLGEPDLPGTILRLPKVYGKGSNDDFGTVYRARNHPSWRWTHGYVENVAAAITLAVVDARAAGRVYNVGEQYTPTVDERLRHLPASDMKADEAGPFNYAQDIVYDTGLIRAELGYREIVSYEEGLRRTRAGE